ncbi:MAG: thiamine pyrophosphate-binding protein [Rhodospirillaceae bacterium]|nr:thiamine pyrophosphate-binding protein [Rhodospirillaceae bacterium]
MPDPHASASRTVGDLVAAFLEECGVATAFGVISIHNMPILDAFARRNRIRFVAARGEQGALNMADAYARVSGGLGVGITSTGVAAGNAAGSMVEALTAGTPVLHLTGQVELAYLDRARAYIHEAPKQPDMLKAVSKAYFRIWSPGEALGVLREAVRTALTPPAGPVSVEIPIDVQAAPVDWPDRIAAPPVPPQAPSDAALDALAAALAAAKRPLIWLGGGARGAAKPATALADLGIGIVTSVNGRGVVPEDHKMTLGAFNVSPAVEAFYQSCDLLVVVGSRLRGNETLKHQLKLPAKRIQVDVDLAMEGRAYPTEMFIRGDAAAVLEGLLPRLAGRLAIDPAFAGDLAKAKQTAIKGLKEALGANYAALAEAVRKRLPKGAPWVRDITLSNSTWGNRYTDLADPRQGVHSLGGAIGQGVPMAVGAALARPEVKTVALAGDGGFIMTATELATAVQEQANVVFILMNDGGYGVIRNIQDAHYGARRAYADLVTPDFAKFAASLGVAHRKVDSIAAFEAAFDAALAAPGPHIVEVDMVALGPFARPFAGPPVRAKT